MVDKQSRHNTLFWFQVLSFAWDIGPVLTEIKSDNQNADTTVNEQQSTPYSIVQVIDDDAEGKFRPVIGGYDSGSLSTNDKYYVAFKLQGTFKFKIRNHPKDPPPLVINVFEEEPVLVQISDSGFSPRFIKIGNK
jgi:hypothetical protein